MTHDQNAREPNAGEGPGSLDQQAIRGGGFVAVSRLTYQIVQMAGTMVLARLLVPEEFGLIAMATSILSLFHIFNDMGLIDATLQGEEYSDDHGSQLFFVNVFVNLSLVLLLSASSPLIARFFAEPRMIPITITLSFELLFLSLGNQHFARMKRDMRFGRVAIVLVVASVGSNAGAILLAASGAGYWALVARALLVPAIRALGAWLATGWRPRLCGNRNPVKAYVKFGIKTSAALAVGHIGSVVDKALIGRGYGSTALGYYNRAFVTMMLPVTQLTTSLHHVAVSTLRRLRGNNREFLRYYLRAISLITFLITPLCAFLWVSSPETIYLFLGPGWEASAPVLAAFGATMGFRILYMTNAWVHVSLGRAKRRLIWEVFATVLNAIAILLSLRHGLMAVAWVVSLSPVVLAIPSLMYAGRSIGITVAMLVGVLWKYVLSGAASAVATIAVLSLIPPDSSVVSQVLASGATVAVSYCGSICLLFWGIGPFRQAFRLFRRFVKRKK